MKTVPDRFFRRAAARPGNARDRQRKIRAELFPRAHGHFPRHRFAHRAVLLQGFRAHAEKCFLRVVGVAHHAAEKNFRRARHIRHAVRNDCRRCRIPPAPAFAFFPSTAAQRRFQFRHRQNQKCSRREFFAPPPRRRGRFFPRPRRRPSAARPPRRAARSSRFPTRVAPAAANRPPPFPARAIRRCPWTAACGRQKSPRQIPVSAAARRNHQTSAAARAAGRAA